jgi:PPOX class probable FMN-dependent enzyme
LSDDETLQSVGDLRGIYREPSRPVRDKAFAFIDKHARRFIELSPFFCIGSVGPDQLADVSPRGGEPGFVLVLDDTHIAFPDRPGNNRLDTLTNVMHSPAVGLLFFIPGVHEMLRFNGITAVTTRQDLMARFVHDGKEPRSVIIIEAREVYFHCSKALRRSDLWNPDKRVDRSALPTFGQIAKDQFNTIVPARLIDYALERDAKKNLY